MRSLTIILFITITTICSAQQTTKLADSIRKAYKIPALSYAVVTDKSIVEIQAHGLHSIALTDLSTINDRFHRLQH